ncbi:MAG TPA: hypothetical protein V6C95_16515 [Coleofasciculaceae cyanobacterium]
MQAQDNREIGDSGQRRARENSSAALTPDKTPSYGIGFILALIFLLGNLLVAAIYFHLINL